VSRVDRLRLPEVGADPVFTFPAIVRHTLANGLSVRTVEHHNVPVITFALQVEGGSGADPADSEGLAALVADMVDEGSGPRTAIEISDALARIGAEYDVDVGGDSTLFTLTTLTRFASRGALLLADMVTRPSLRASDFTRVRQLRLDRLRQLKDLASALAEHTFLKLLYGPHPYGHLPIGGDASLRRVSLEQVAAFHRETFQPSQTTLVVCGAMSHEGLLRCAEDGFGGWAASGSAGGDAVATPDAEPRRAPLARLAVVPREGAAQSELRIGHLTTGRATPDYASLLVMNAVLGGQFVSRVNLKLREEKGYTYGARTGFDWRRGASPFVLQTSVHTAATADAIALSLAEIDAIRGLRAPTETELTLAKASLTRGYPRGFEAAQQVARSVAQIALYGLPDTYFSEFVPKVNAVSSDDVVDAAARHLDSSRLTTLVVGDQAAIADTLSGIGLGDAQVFPAEL
jgi:predicted Zn-dependent peptidase